LELEVAAVAKVARLAAAVAPTRAAASAWTGMGWLPLPIPVSKYPSQR